MKKNVFNILVILFLSVVAQAQDQQVDLYGAYESSYGVTVGKKEDNGFTGMNLPRSKYTWRVKKKLRRLRWTQNEMQAWMKKEYGTGELSAKETAYYISAKRKENKRNRIVARYYADTVTNTKAFLSNSEKQLLDKAENDTVKLSLTEKVKVWNIKRKEKRLEKQTTSLKLTASDSLLLEKMKSDTVKLTTKEKVQALKLQHKQKRIKKKQLEEYENQGGWTPTKTKSGLGRVIAKTFDFKGKRSPSPYMKKLDKLQRKYTLTDNEREAYKKQQEGLFLLPKEQRLAARAEAKIWTYNAKKNLVKKRYFMQLQDKETRKRIKKNVRRTARHYRKELFRRQELSLGQKMKLWLT